jgi:hypothetical protein
MVVFQSRKTMKETSKGNSEPALSWEVRFQNSFFGKKKRIFHVSLSLSLPRSLSPRRQSKVSSPTSDVRLETETQINSESSDRGDTDPGTIALAKKWTEQKKTCTNSRQTRG